MSPPLEAAWPVFRLTLSVSGAAVLLASLVGIPLGVRLSELPERLRARVAGIVHAGMAAPPVVVGLALYLLLSRSGPLGFLGWLYSPAAMILAQTLLALPFVAGIVLSSVSALPAELPLQLEALGAGPRRTRRLLLREAAPGIGLAVAAALGRSLSEVGAVLMVGGNIEGHTRVLTTAIILETSKGNFELALFLGGILLLAALLVNLALVRFYARSALRG